MCGLTAVFGMATGTSLFCDSRVMLRARHADVVGVLYSMNVTVMFIVCGSMTAFKMAISTFLCILQITIF
jgi:hypothetical protein